MISIVATEYKRQAQYSEHMGVVTCVTCVVLLALGKGGVTNFS